MFATLFYGLLYYIDFLVIVVRRIRIIRVEKWISYLVAFSTILIPIILSILGIQLYVRGKMWNDVLSYYGWFAIGSLLFFFLSDIAVRLIIKDAKEESQKQVNNLKKIGNVASAENLASAVSFWTNETLIRMAEKNEIRGTKDASGIWSFQVSEIILYFEREFVEPLDPDVYWSFVKYVDSPTLGAVITVEAFRFFSRFGDLVDVFYFGATAFQLIAFNLVFTIFLVTTILQEYRRKICVKTTI